MEDHTVWRAVIDRQETLDLYLTLGRTKKNYTSTLVQLRLEVWKGVERTPLCCNIMKYFYFK